MTSNLQSAQALAEIVTRSRKCLPENPIPWDQLGHVKVIKQWAEEIRAVTSRNGNASDWSLVSHAVTFFSPDVEECRYLAQRIAHDIGFDLAILKPQDVIQLFSDEEFDPGFSSPTLIYLEPGSWMMDVGSKKSDDSEDENIAIAQERLIDLIRHFNPELPVLFVTSTDDFSEFSKEFKYAGLFDRRFAIIPLTLEETASRFLGQIGLNICGDSLTNYLGKVGKLLDLDFDDKRQQGIIAMALKRLAARNMRKVEFIDLVNLAMRSSCEADESPVYSDSNHLRQIAVHEAGHATIAIIDSNGNNIPDYASIIQGLGFKGIVANSYAYHYASDDQLSYSDFRHRVRIDLAGRAAEHLVFGSENILARAARGDLKNATSFCHEMFATCGISTSMEISEGVGANLAIVLDKPSPSESSGVESMVQSYLKKQYDAVLDLLRSNRKLLDSVTDKLLQNRLLDQNDLSKMLESLKGI